MFMPAQRQFHQTSVYFVNLTGMMVYVSLISMPAQRQFPQTSVYFVDLTGMMVYVSDTTYHYDGSRPHGHPLVLLCSGNVGTAGYTYAEAQPVTGGQH